MPKQDKYSNGHYQDVVGVMVSKEVLYNVNEIVDTIGKTQHCEDVYDMAVSYDWVEPAEYHLYNDMTRDDRLNWLSDNGYFDIKGMQSWTAGKAYDELLNVLKENDSHQEYCEEHDIEPHSIETFEYWLVSDWLASQLEDKGENVNKDFHGLTVWSRTTTGQAIILDSVICDIFDSSPYYSSMFKTSLEA